jgi:hypothetical protein
MRERGWHRQLASANSTASPWRRPPSLIKNESGQQPRLLQKIRTHNIHVWLHHRQKGKCMKRTCVDRLFQSIRNPDFWPFTSHASLRWDRIVVAAKSGLTHMCIYFWLEDRWPLSIIGNCGESKLASWWWIIKLMPLVWFCVCVRSPLVLGWVMAWR